MPFTIAPLGNHWDEQKSPAGGAAACVWERRAAAARKNARGRAYVEEGIVEGRECTGQGGVGGWGVGREASRGRMLRQADGLYPHKKTLSRGCWRNGEAMHPCLWPCFAVRRAQAVNG